ncbi:MAG: DUF4332 domain-containing protein [Planctomycetaceae bacterium]|nr:DUF4332 domain-containing protein [Planctomycetaceae bacterium]
MKLTDLFIQGTRQRQDIKLGPFSDGVSVICGDSGAERTSVLEFFRDACLGLKADFDPYGTYNQAGSLGLQFASISCELNRGQESRTLIKRRFSGGEAEHWNADALADYLAPVDSELFDSVFCVSFLETAANARRLAGALYRQLGVPVGRSSMVERDAVLKRERDSQMRLEQLAVLRKRIEALELERREMLDSSDRNQKQQSTELSLVELEINNVVAAINEIGQQRAGVVSECNNYETPANLNPIQTSSSKVEFTAEGHELSSLYARLDHVEGQIHRWRKFQLSVHEQRVQIRDEMAVWNGLTLDSDEHPYHHSREILVSLENKVDEVDRNAKHWGDAAAARVDTASMARTVGAICNSMREDLYGLCDELAHQYKHMRHKSAAAELRQLRALYNEIGSNLQKLSLERKSIAALVRESDVFGANLISLNETSFLASARALGYEKARDRYFAETAAKANGAGEVADDFQKRLTAIDRRRTELLASARSLETELELLRQRHLSLLEQRSALIDLEKPLNWTAMVKEIDQKLISLRYQCEALNSQSEIELPAANPIVEVASLAMERLTGGEFDAIWLGSSLQSERTSENAAAAVELIVRNRLGHEVEFSQLSPELQNRIYLALVLGVKNHLRENGIEIPTFIDHAFAHLSDNDIHRLLEQVESMAGAGHQVILLGRPLNNSALLPSKVFEIPTTTQVAEVFAAGPSVAIVTEPEWRPEDFVATEVYATGFLPRPYPLSKYPRSQAQWAIEEDDSIVSLPFPVSGQKQISAQETNASVTPQNQPAVSSVSVSMIGDRLGYVSRIDETTELDRLGFFDTKQLRLFHDQGIESVGDLLVVDGDVVGELNLHSEQLDRWQAQLWLLMHVPGLRTPDAKVLVACGITDPEHLGTSFPQQILERIDRFFSTSEGRHFGVNRESITLDRINGWYRSLDRVRVKTERSENTEPQELKIRPGEDSLSGRRKPGNRKPYQRTARGYQARDFAPEGNVIKSNRASKTARLAKANSQPMLARPPRMHSNVAGAQVAPSIPPVPVPEDTEAASSKPQGKKKKAKSTALKFYLDLSDHVEAAPSIGPKTAERFEKIGVSTVAEFLKHTAESMEAKLDYKRISEKIIRVWQHQARLVCRIPNLRGHDSQLLVACGITEPETLATMQPQALYEIIGPFAETKEGQKIIRNGKKPDLEEVSNWITWASNFRSLQAA